MSSLDKLLLETALQFGEDGKRSENSRPFKWYNCLQKGRPMEYTALMEFAQKLQSGKSFVVYVVIFHFLSTLPSFTVFV